MKIAKKHIIWIVVFLMVAALSVLLITRNIRENEREENSHQLISADTMQLENGLLLDSKPDDVWSSDESSGYNSFTTKKQLGVKEGSIGILVIPKINVECHVFDSNNAMEDMKKGAAHFLNTSYWDGNVALSAHIGNLDYCYFERLKELKKGDLVSYTTTFGVRDYTVQTISVISDDDWSMMERSENNRLTLITCVAGKDNQRLCVQAVEVN